MNQGRIRDERKSLIGLKFQRKHKVQGRTVYERIGEDEYWDVDNFHKDGSVHLEVFRMSDGMFLGTCDIEDVNKFKAATKKEIAKKAPLKF